MDYKYNKLLPSSQILDCFLLTHLWAWSSKYWFPMIKHFMQEESPQHFDDKNFLRRDQIYICQVAENSLREQAANWSYETSSWHSSEWYPWLGSYLEVSDETLSADSTCTAEFQGHWEPSQHKEYPEITTHLHGPQHQKDTGFLSSFTRCKWKHPN